MQSPANFYSNVYRRLKGYVFDKYNCNDLSDDNSDYSHVKRLNDNSSIWLMVFPYKNYDYRFLVAIPKSFPDDFPKIYLPKDEYNKFKYLPHIDHNRFVCTRDDSVVYINDEKPEEAFEELVKIAANILHQGKNGHLESDLQKEFLAYWEDNVFLKVLLIDKLDVNDKPIILKLDPLVFNCNYIASASRDSANNFLSKIDKQDSLSKSIKIICIRIDTLPLNRNNIGEDLLLIFKQLNVIHRKKLYSFKGNFAMIVSKLNGNDLYFGFFVPNSCFSGFRKLGKVPFMYKLSKSFHNITKIRIIRMDRKRLVERTSKSLLSKKELHVAIAGCGSVGSELAMLLAKSGVSHLNLFDPDNLNIENAARHLCGISDLGSATNRNKAVLIKKTIEGHLPYVNCSPFSNDILDILRNNNTVLLESDLVVLAIANVSAERRVNDFLLENKKPIVFLWLEPYCIGGHILYVSNENGGCFRCCYNPTGEFKYSIALDSPDLHMRETGCQSTYTPYGAPDLSYFCGIACKIILQIIESPLSSTTLYTVIGDKEYFQAQGHKIRENYIAHDSYRVYKKHITPSEGCICNSQR